MEEADAREVQWKPLDATTEPQALSLSPPWPSVANAKAQVWDTGQIRNGIEKKEKRMMVLNHNHNYHQHHLCYYCLVLRDHS